MGFETANTHQGSGKAGAIRSDLKKRGSAWLAKAAGQMVKAVTADWEEWRRFMASRARA